MESFPSNNIYYKDRYGILYNADTIELLKEFNENSIDLIVTSPPYNVGIKYDSWNDNMMLDEYFDFVLEFMELFKRVLKPSGRFAINILYDVNMKQNGNHHRLSPLCEYYSILKKVGLKYASIVDLVEEHPHRTKYTAWGSYMSASSPYIYNPKECILIGYKDQWKREDDGKSTMTKEEFIEIVGGLWKYRAETRKLTQANFSMDIPLKAIKGMSYEDDIILDPFSGSGTTLYVAK